MPDRVMRQFGITQSVPVEPIAPLSCSRPAIIKGINGYKLTFATELLRVWDEEDRPLIDLRGPEATHLWDVTEEYVAYLEEYSHPYVDPRSRLRPVAERPQRQPVVETHMVRNLLLI